MSDSHNHIDGWVKIIYSINCQNGKKTKNEQMNLKEYLQLSRLSQNELSSVLGFDKSIVSRWVNGDRLPSRESIKKIHHLTKGAVSWTDW